MASQWQLKSCTGTATVPGGYTVRASGTWLYDMMHPDGQCADSNNSLCNYLERSWCLLMKWLVLSNAYYSHCEFLFGRLNQSVERFYKQMNGVLGHDSALRLNWAGDNLGEWEEFCYESWRRIDPSTCWPAVHASALLLYYGCLQVLLARDNTGLNSTRV